MDLTRLNLVEAKKGLLKKEFSAEEITKAFIARLENTRHLNAFITETPENALSRRH
jgi:aspartyl-tRNA(Asn)/glutamyl-tRNA(Gln) amidotransferase subunit A